MIKTKDISYNIENFRFALISLIEAFTKGSILYLDGEQGDDFDCIAEALFKSFVIIPLVDAELLTESSMKFIYGSQIIDKSTMIISKNNNVRGVFRQFSTRNNPFDIVCVSKEFDDLSFSEFSTIGTEYFIEICE